ncbi:hypothetical protein MSPP1_002688 [Malassezia sp. CBS 17886]|nr:hypothetical protein MSPP1_002688 [Malassezia sp. CBS 17886]
MGVVYPATDPPAYDEAFPDAGAPGHAESPLQARAAAHLPLPRPLPADATAGECAYAHAVDLQESPSTYLPSSVLYSRGCAASATCDAPPAPSPGIRASTDMAAWPTDDAYAQKAHGADDGIYLNQAPDLEKFSARQREIAAEYPADLDEEPRNLVQTVWQIACDWRVYVQWRYVRTSRSDALSPPDYYVIAAVIIAIAVCVSVFHSQIVSWLRPVSEKVRRVSWGWIIPVLILFALSFPPLFGAEVVAVLCGVVYGVWIGFGIVAAGTLLGEIGNYYVFRYFLKNIGARGERKSMLYATMASIIRNGGFITALAMRLSVVPGHITTALFATVGMPFWRFFFAALLSQPKMLSVVYLGLWHRMDQVKPDVQRDLRMERYKRLKDAAAQDPLHPLSPAHCGGDPLGLGENGDVIAVSASAKQDDCELDVLYVDEPALGSSVPAPEQQGGGAACARGGARHTRPVQKGRVQTV